jgi:hypothetical protein
MFRGDYMSFPIGESTALLPAVSSINVGRQNISDITKDNIGSVKKWKDIIEYGAVLISDEVITWIPPAPKPPVNETAPDESAQKNTAADKAKEVIKTVIDSVIQ